MYYNPNQPCAPVNPATYYESQRLADTFTTRQHAFWPLAPHKISHRQLEDTINHTSYHTTPPNSFQTNIQHNETNTKIAEQRSLASAKARRYTFRCIALPGIHHLLLNFHW